MANNNELTQITNQEAIFEEINEEELEEVVGGGILTPTLVGLGASPDALQATKVGLVTAVAGVLEILL